MGSMRTYIYIALGLLLAGCRTPRETRERVRVDIRTETKYVTDTLFVEIPSQVAERETRDSVSRLENDYAVSEARVTADGLLAHWLRTKPQQKAVEYLRPVEWRDSVVYVDRARTETVEVAKPLTWWQKTRIYGFYAALLLLAVTHRKVLIGLVSK